MELRWGHWNAFCFPLHTSTGNSTNIGISWFPARESRSEGTELSFCTFKSEIIHWWSWLFACICAWKCAGTHIWTLVRADFLLKYRPVQYIYPQLGSRRERLDMGKSTELWQKPLVPSSQHAQVVLKENQEAALGRIVTDCQIVNQQ